ncbi:YbhB/YbcL family Raf kinase inhibitor-like protein [Methanofollis fontis]|uniref:YbhB/YbcL family Raf kinase inhibitor-like protein n=1 Tax=Methanofollis fontis TaxID=2052832 RepID=A0A483CVM8_9EURY|nr:YbhB/YbcL family Raf kinase inhibitor-like protein [Methanofollis fontis]TAJ45057.1 YbhB/YbcL family Raf kinase inhibitor-like protein [Methanofollis fontis]
MAEQTGLKRIVVRLDFVEFPKRHTCDGEGVSPRLIIEGMEAPSIALIVHNPYEEGCSFSPWCAWNIEPLRFSDGTAVIPEGIAPEPEVSFPVRMVQGRNDYGRIGYQGPCPPAGETHRYYFRIYGLDGDLPLPPGSVQHELVAAMRGHGLEYGETVAMYTRT